MAAAPASEASVLEVPKYVSCRGPEADTYLVTSRTEAEPTAAAWCAKDSNGRLQRKLEPGCMDLKGLGLIWRQAIEMSSQRKLVHQHQPTRGQSL